MKVAAVRDKERNPHDPGGQMQDENGKEIEMGRRVWENPPRVVEERHLQQKDFMGLRTRHSLR
jgi:hypothetical protein